MGVRNLLIVPLSKIFSSTSVVRGKPLQCLVWTSLFISYIHYITRPPLALDFPTPTPTPPTPPPLEDIPHKIWQTLLDSTPNADSVQTWITQNPDYQYTLVSSSGANALAQKHYANRREILYLFLSLQDAKLRSDLFRYMLLESEGGVYSALDTTALRPIEQWIPPRQKKKQKVRAIVVIESETAEGEVLPGTESPHLRFCPWTMAASRGHPLMARAVRDTVEALRLSAIKNEMTVAETRLGGDEGMGRISGQDVWTRAVLTTLSEAMGMEVSWRNLSGLRRPRVFADVMVLPVDAFETGQSTSGSLMRMGGRGALVRHGGRGSWRDE